MTRWRKIIWTWRFWQHFARLHWPGKYAHYCPSFSYVEEGRRVQIPLDVTCREFFTHCDCERYRIIEPEDLAL